MTDISKAARAEVHERYPIWRDSGVGIKQAARYRDGFVAGAEWADARYLAGNDRVMAGWRHAQEELQVVREAAAAKEELLQAREAAAEEALTAARELTKLEAAARLNPFTPAARESLILQVADIIGDAAIHITPDGQSIVGDPSATARTVLNMILDSGAVRAGDTMQFEDDLPAAGSARDGRVDWARVKESLIANEGSWGLLVTNVSSSTPQQLRAGKNQHFRGNELEHFEFRTRRPRNPQVPYAPLRTDLWGRYTGRDPRLQD